jgi:hypothetical protein
MSEAGFAIERSRPGAVRTRPRSLCRLLRAAVLSAVVAAAAAAIVGCGFYT